MGLLAGRTLAEVLQRNRTDCRLVDTASLLDGVAVLYLPQHLMRSKRRRSRLRSPNIIGQVLDHTLRLRANVLS